MPEQLDPDDWFAEPARRRTSPGEDEWFADAESREPTRGFRPSLPFGPRVIAGGVAVVVVVVVALAIAGVFSGSSHPRSTPPPTTSPTTSPTTTTTPAPSPGAQLATSKPGDRGTKVKRLQRALATLGYYSSKSIDGDYGPATAAAVKQFQKSVGLTQDGVVGPHTVAALKTALRRAG
jgi:Putative peptidoglycan binding domain